jgi:hypothetical protein
LALLGPDALSGSIISINKLKTQLKVGASSLFSSLR